MSAKDQPAKDAFPWGRDPRVPLTADIHVRRLGNRKAGVTLHDLSKAGCKVEVQEIVEPGELVWVSLPGLQPIEARVAWAKTWVIGVKFTNALHPAVLDALLPRMTK